MKIICIKCGRECCTCSGCKSPDGKHCPGCFNIIKNEQKNASNTTNTLMRQLPLSERDATESGVLHV